MAFWRSSHAVFILALLIFVALANLAKASNDGSKRLDLETDRKREMDLPVVTDLHYPSMIAAIPVASAAKTTAQEAKQTVEIAESAGNNMQRYVAAL